MASGIRRIEIPTPFPVGSVNAWLLLGEPLTLVDCGPLTDEAWAELRSGVEASGRKLEEVRRVVLTHRHPDHGGLAERVRSASGCRVYAHPADHERLLDQPGVGEDGAAFIVETCRRAGVPAARVEAVAAGLESYRRYTEPLSAVESLEEGDEIELGGRSWRALHTPGHARGAVCLWDEATRTLASGDTLLPQISSNALPEPDPARFRRRTLPEYRRTLVRLGALAPRRVAPGHGTPLEGGVGELVEGRLAFQDRRARQIARYVGEGLRTPWQIAQRLFPEAPPAAAFLAVSEVVGHLDLLADRGALSFEGQEEGSGWEAGVKPA